MKQKSLIQTSEEIRDILFYIEDCHYNNKEVPVEAEEKLNELIDFRDNKIDRCVNFINFAKKQTEFLDDEIEHLKNQKKKIENSVNYLKDLAKAVMQSEGLLEIKGHQGHKFRLQEFEKVEIESIDLLPEDVLRKKISYEADKVTIKRMIKEGLEVRGAKIVKSTSVIVK